MDLLLLGEVEDLIDGHQDVAEEQDTWNDHDGMVDVREGRHQHVEQHDRWQDEREPHQPPDPLVVVGVVGDEASTAPGQPAIQPVSTTGCDTRCPAVLQPS